MSRMDSRASGKHRGLDARPPPGRNRALSGAFDRGRGARMVLDSGFRRNDGLRKGLRGGGGTEVWLGGE